MNIRKYLRVAVVSAAPLVVVGVALWRPGAAKETKKVTSKVVPIPPKASTQSAPLPPPAR